MLFSFYRAAAVRSFFKLCCAVTCAASLSSAAQAQDPNAPLVVGALGDSISAGFNAQRFGDNRDLSWSTGENPNMKSHIKRLRESTQRQAVGYNESIAGSVSLDLDRQVNRLIQKKPDYVTITIGANDVCTWDGEWEDDLAAYEGKVRSGLTKLVGSNPNIKIVLSPIPDLYNLWEVSHVQPGCQAKWDLMGMCKQMLGRNVNEEGRQGVVRRWEAANQTLARIARDYQGNVLFDIELANTKFEWKHVSPMDCFHPSTAGQNLLAEMAWQLILADQ